MKQLALVTAIWSSAVLFCLALGKEKILLVKMSDRVKETSYKLMSPVEFKALQNEIKNESRFHAKAMTLAKKAWKADKEVGRKPFPKASISVRKAVSAGTYSDMEKASKKLDHYEDRAYDKAEEEAEKEKKKAKNKSEEQLEREKEKAEAKEKLCEKAHELFETKLKELMNPPEQSEGAKK